MRIVITEDQFNDVISSQTEGLDLFMDELISTYPTLEEFKDIIVRFIAKSDCKKIEFSDMNMASGLSLHNAVLINKHLLADSDYGKLLFVIFHEIAHQYQFKKYGAEKMYELYVGKLDLNDAVDFLYNTEITADEFAQRKCREFVKLGIIDKVPLTMSYKKAGKLFISSMYNHVKKILADRKSDTPEHISEVLYNFIKTKMAT